METTPRSARVQKKQAGNDSQKGERSLETSMMSRQERSRVQTRSLNKCSSMPLGSSEESGQSKLPQQKKTMNAPLCVPSDILTTSNPRSSRLGSRTSPTADQPDLQEPLSKAGQATMAKINAYPTPDSSPKSQTASSSLILRRSNTSPASLPDVTKRYIERASSKMSPLLESIEVGGPQIHSKGDHKKAAAEDQTEVCPLPVFICDSAVTESLTISDSWPRMREGTPDLEMDLKNPEFITSHELDKELEGLSSSPDYPADSEDSDHVTSSKSENYLMLVPEATKSPGTQTHQPQSLTSHRIVGGSQTIAQSYTSQVDERGGSVTAQCHKHPKSDSGIGSTQGSPGNSFLFKEYKGPDYMGSGDLFFGELSSYATVNPVEKVYNTRIEGDGFDVSSGSSSCAVEVSETVVSYNGHHGSSSQLNGTHASHDVSGSTMLQLGEPTPPNSAVSPSAFSPAEAWGFPKNERLATESISAIVDHILNPILNNPDFKDFWSLCEQAKQRLFQGKIFWLRDLEKFLFDGVPAVRTLSSYKAFCEAFLNKCQRALPYIRESDQQRPYDEVYSPAYFIDALHRAKESADASAATNTKVMLNPGNRQSIGETPRKHGKKSKLNDASQFPDIISSGSLKRKMLGGVDSGESRAKRAMTPNKAFESAPPRLAIQTAIPVGYYNNYQEPRSSSPLQVQNAGFPLNATFDLGQGVLTTNQSRQFNEYSYTTSKAMPTMATTPRSSNISADNYNAMARQSFSFTQPPTPADTNYVGSPLVPETSFGPPRSNSRSVSRRKASAEAGKSDEDTPVYLCDQCPREFPRPCDLTKHKKTHERPFKCDDHSCKYHREGFPTNKERERHQNDIHAATTKEWKCDYLPCQYKSKRESNCKQHMEKAHGYTYKRMKRNPRKRPEQLTKPVTTSNKKRVGAVRKVSAVTGKSCASKGVKAQRLSHPEAPRTTPIPSHNPDIVAPDAFAMYPSYPQQPTTLGIDDYPLMDSGASGQPYFGGSPTTDFEPSPASVAIGFGSPMDPYEPANSIMEGSGWLPSQDSGFLEFFSHQGEYNYEHCAPYDEGMGDDDTVD